MASTSSRDVFRLLDLPHEILLKVFEFIFLEFNAATPAQQLQDGNEWAIKVARPRYTLGSYYQMFNRDRFLPFYNELVSSGNLGLSHGTTSALLICRSLHQIAAEAFYQLYPFEIFPAESFRTKFSKLIGPTNLRHIRSLKFGLPHATKTMPSLYLPRYLRLLAEEMPLLEEFTVTTSTGHWPRTITPGDPGIEKSRGLLLFGSYVTLRHPRLKFATWYEDNTFNGREFDLNDDSGNMSVVVTAKRPNNLQSFEDPEETLDANSGLTRDQEAISKRVKAQAEEVEAYRTNLAAYNEYTARQAFQELPLCDPSFSEEYWDENGLLKSVAQPIPRHPYVLENWERRTLDNRPTFIIPPYGLLLDSYKIRRAGFLGLVEYPKYRPYTYQMPPDASSSEVSTPSPSALSEDELCDELFKYNKNREATAEGMPDSIDAESLIARAEAIEKDSIRAEQFAKAGFYLED